MKTASSARRIYISGPMTGMEDLNREAFAAAENLLREQGNIPINPHRFPEQGGYQDYLQFDLELEIIILGGTKG